MTTTRKTRERQAMEAELDQIGAWVLGGPTVKNPRTHWEAKKRRLLAIYDRNGEAATVDGYKSRHGDSSGAGGLTAVPTGDPNEPGSVVMDGLIGLVFRRQAGTWDGDVVNAAVQIIAPTVTSIWRGTQRIDNADRTVPANPGQAAPEAAKCSHCQLEPGDRETDVNGALPGAKFLGLWCIQFVQDQGTAGLGSTRRGWAPRLPNATEIEAWQAGRKPRARIDPKAAFRWSDGSTTGTQVSDGTPPPAA